MNAMKTTLLAGCIVLGTVALVVSCGSSSSEVNDTDADTRGDDGGSGNAGGNGSAGSGGSPAPDISGPSCSGMRGNECQGKNCCSSIPVPGGTFRMGRSENGTDACPVGETCGDDEVPEHDVTVSDFYLDEFEVTVGRFRRFVEDFSGPPAQGAGAHPLLPDSGWQTAWNSLLAATKEELTDSVKCRAKSRTWQDTPGSTEHHPINCLDWYAAFAFCVWDGGRLATEAEWEYAAAGGDENRLYPWGSAEPTSTLVSYDGCSSNCNLESVLPVGSLPEGAGRWGHKDLAGNIGSWVLDSFDSSWYRGGGSTCDNCANLAETPGRTIRGGSFAYFRNDLRAASRSYTNPSQHSSQFGVRCARTR